MTTTIARPVLALAAVTALAGAAAFARGAQAELPTIKEIAPPQTVIVGSVPNAAAAYERLKGTALWRLWTSEELAETRKEFLESMHEGLDEMSKELGVEKADIRAPTGELGFAVFPVLDEKAGITRPGYMLMADYQEHADATAGIIDKWIEAAAKEDGLEHDERDVLGRTVKVFNVAKAVQPLFENRPEPDGGFGDGGAGEGGMDGMGGMGDLFAPGQMLFGGVQELYLVREKSAFILSTDMQAVRRALEVCDGEAQQSLAERDDFRAVMAQTGAGDAWAMILTRDLGPIAMGMDPMGMVAMIGPMLKQFVGDIQGAGASWRLAGDQAMIEQTSFFYMPNGRAGLTALVDTESPRGAPPGFVAPNAINYGHFNVEFDGVPALVRSVLQMMPMLAMQMEQGGDAPRPDELVAQVCASLGKKVHVIGTVERPLTATSLSQLVAIECTKPQELENLLGAVGATMGLSGRDFLGQRVYDIPAEAMMMGGMPGMPGMPGAAAPPPSSIGLAGGYVFVGPTPAVEQALRAVPAHDAPSLAGEAIFKRASEALGSEPAVAWGWVNVIESAEVQATVRRLEMEALMREMANEDPELAAQMGGGDLEALEEWSDDIDFALVRRYVGPMSWVFRATESGFVGKSYVFDAGTN